jgi:hypothetical protein
MLLGIIKSADFMWEQPGNRRKEKNMKIRQNEYGSWHATQDGEVICVAGSLPRLLIHVKPGIGDDLPSLYYERVLRQQGFVALVKAAWRLGHPPVRVLPLP